MNKEIVRSIPILNYHKIDDRWEVGVNCVKPVQFFRQLNWLHRNGYHTITFQDIAENVSLPEKPIIISFDDGYESVYLNALPAMQKFGYRGVVFALTGYFGKENRWDANLLGKTFRHLEVRQLQQLSKAGFEIASHGVTHLALVNLRREAVLAELELSRQLLSMLAGRECITFAYPFGIQNSEIRDLVRAAGYHFACVNVWGGKTRDAFLLPRFPIYRFDTSQTLKRFLTPHPFGFWESLKARLISWPARLTPVYQNIRFSHPDQAIYEEQRNLIERFSI